MYSESWHVIKVCDSRSFNTNCSGEVFFFGFIRVTPDILGEALCLPTMRILSVYTAFNYNDGIWFQICPSSVRPSSLFFELSHCLKKNGMFFVFASSRNILTVSRSRLTTNNNPVYSSKVYMLNRLYQRLKSYENIICWKKV